MGSKLREHVCATCHRLFTSYKVTQETCSKQCAGRLKSLRNSVECICQACGTTFRITTWDATVDGRGNYCSRQCSGAGRRSSIDRESVLASWEQGKSARQIAASIGVSPMTLRRWLIAEGIYETRHARGAALPFWNGGTQTYREIAFKRWGKRCQHCGYDRYESVIQVHHLDRDRENNSPENVVPLCPTCHAEAHYLTQAGLYAQGERREANMNLC